MAGQGAKDLTNATGRDVRLAARSGTWIGPTAGLALGYVQANLVVLPKAYAYDFLVFCQRNPKPCPVLEVTDVGSPRTPLTAADADLRTDLPGYWIYRDGRLVDEVTDISGLWRDDLVAFLLGCSFTFEAALADAGIPVRHVELGCNVPMYVTSIRCQRAGVFDGPLVVSMRPMKPGDAIRAVSICRRFQKAHGVPVHLGDPAAIGIDDLDRPDYGDSVPIEQGEIPVFWACGVTPQEAIKAARLPLAITHKPGHMFVTDLCGGEEDDG